MLEGSGVRPTTVYVTGGLHLLHLRPARPWEFLGEWMRAEELVVEFLDVAANLNPRRIVLMTAHSICESKYTAGWQLVAQAVAKDPEKYGNESCSNILGNLTQAGFRAEDCARGTLTRAGD